jgi:hypothetical protein
MWVIAVTGELGWFVDFGRGRQGQRTVLSLDFSSTGETALRTTAKWNTDVETTC